MPRAIVFKNSIVKNILQYTALLMGGLTFVHGIETDVQRDF